MKIEIVASKTCGPCIATKRALDSKGIAYELTDSEQVPEERREFLRKLGMTLPIVIVDGGRDHWCGFRPDKIAELA